VKPGTVSNGIMSGLDWFPTLVAAAGNPDINSQLLKGAKLGDRSYKVHLDGYDQTDMLTGNGPSKRHEIWYFAQTKLGALRYDNYKYQFIVQPQGWIGPSVYPNMPILTNLRQDPFERMGWPSNGFSNGSIAYWDSFKHEMWRFVVPGQVIAKYIPSMIEYPPMQAGGNFSIQDLKEKVEAAQKAASAGNE
jgi:hypothetical protein